MKVRMELNPKYPMHNRIIRVMIAAAALVALSLAPTPAAAQAPAAGLFPAYTAPRASDGESNLNVIWQAFITANWDVEAHSAQPAPHPGSRGVCCAGRGGLRIVE